jgi:hypothetical protein
MSPAGSSNAPEARARARIDQALTEAGWTLQDRDDMNLAAADAIAVREFKLDRSHGYVDYMLFLDGHLVGVCEANRNLRKATWDEKKRPEGRWRAFAYDEIAARDKCSLDIFWLKDESLEDSANLPEPHVLAEEIADDLRSALEQIESVLADLQLRAESRGPWR